MRELLRVSGKDLGSLELADFCPRCYWIARHASNGLPYGIFPGIFSSIDSYSKKVIHRWFDASGAPNWLSPLGQLAGYRTPPSFNHFQVRDQATGVLLTGAPDAVFERSDGSLVLAD